MSGAEAELLVADRHQDLRIDRHLWEPVVLAWRNETIFRAKLDIIERKAGAVALWCGIALWYEGGELEVRQSPIVNFQAWQIAGPPCVSPGAQREQREQVHV